MNVIDAKLLEFKCKIEDSIRHEGVKGKESLIRSSVLINLIHEAVKVDLVNHGVNETNIFPPIGSTKPEIKLSGYLKRKNQDVCVIPRGIRKKKTLIDWGPLAFEGEVDDYGFEFTSKTLVINIRSQLSSLAKNADTLFERTFAEALNLHIQYEDIVLGEVYLIPVYEYDDNLAKGKIVSFKRKKTNIEKYISFFTAINSRQDKGSDFSYERCALLIVDFSKEQPKLYNNNQELIADNLISNDFKLDYSLVSYPTFFTDILATYASRHEISDIVY